MTTLEQKARELLARIDPDMPAYSAGELVELANLIQAAGEFPAYPRAPYAMAADALRQCAATPAWEPLTPEVLARLLKEPPAHPQRIYWLAGKNTKTPVMGTIVRSVFEVVFNTGPRLQYASEFTHIMRFITPDLPA